MHVPSLFLSRIYFEGEKKMLYLCVVYLEKPGYAKLIIFFHRYMKQKCPRFDINNSSNGTSSYWLNCP